MDQTYDWTEEFLDTLEELAGDALMLELCLNCRKEYPSRLSQFPAEVWDDLLFRLSDYMTQHVLDLRTLSRRLERAQGRQQADCHSSFVRA